MPSRKTTTNAVLIAVAGLVLAGTVARGPDDAPEAAAAEPRRRHHVRVGADPAGGAGLTG